MLFWESDLKAQDDGDALLQLDTLDLIEYQVLICYNSDCKGDCYRDFHDDVAEDIW